MKDWKKYWNDEIALSGEKDLLRQVGKTVQGQGISADRMSAIVASIAETLRFDASDRVLDLGCGNGYLTSQYASRCGMVVGVDYSDPLLRMARTRFGGAKVTFVSADVRALPADLLATRFDKVLMYEALQHLSTADLRIVLCQLRDSASGQAPVFVASIPDRSRLWNFYDTAERRAEYRRRVASDDEAIGHWWDRADLEALAADCGYRPETLPQPALLHTAHYRMDLLLHSLPVHAPV